MKRNVLIIDPKNNSVTLILKNDQEYIKFIVKNILYAIRNNTVHGKIASRLNSKHKNKDSYESSKYIYLLGYLFLSVMLFVNDDIEAEDLCFNLQNIKNL